MPGAADGSMAGVAVKPLTVAFFEPELLTRLQQEHQQLFWFQLTDEERQQAPSPWGPQNPQALNRYSYVLNNPMRWTDPTGHMVLPPCWYKRDCFHHKIYYGLKRLLREAAVDVMQDVLSAAGVRVQYDPGKGRFDTEHNSYDKALRAARENAGDLGANTRKMYDPKTGTLIGEQSADGRRGWRIDDDHVNWWDWTNGKKASGGRYGHEFFPRSQSGPHSEYPGYAPWEE